MLCMSENVNKQTDSIRAKLFVWIPTCYSHLCHFLHTYISVPIYIAPMLICTTFVIEERKSSKRHVTLSLRICLWRECWSNSAKHWTVSIWRQMSSQRLFGNCLEWWDTFQRQDVDLSKLDKCKRFQKFEIIRLKKF